MALLNIILINHSRAVWRRRLMQLLTHARLRLAFCTLGLTVLFGLIYGLRWRGDCPAGEGRRTTDTVTMSTIEAQQASHAIANSGAMRSRRNGSSSRIPCRVHQSWKTSQLPSARASRWRATWFKCLPDCQFDLWTDEDNLRLIRTHYTWLLPVYQGLRSGVQRADLARYVYMLHYGGIYTDIDTICLRDFRHLLSPWGLVFGGMQGQWIRSLNGSYVQNSFMASEPGHPFWLGLLYGIFLRNSKKSNGGAEESTGPLILMEELQRYLDSGLTDVKIFPPEMFNPFSWITNRKKECKTHGGMSDAEERHCVASFPGAFVVQMHSKSWGGGRA